MNMKPKVICGLKLTHDGSIAVVKGNKLLFSIEMEKIQNNPRYTEIIDTDVIEGILASQNVDIREIDTFVIDGWGGENAGELAAQPRLRIGDVHNSLSAKSSGVSYELKVAQYQEGKNKSNILEADAHTGLRINGKEYHYKSYLHVTGHILSAYCTSEFAKSQKASYVLVWDGGMYPCLYFFDPCSQTVENLGPLFLLIGNVYSIFSQFFGPFDQEKSFVKDSLSVAGKVMAYIALGRNCPELHQIFKKVIATAYDTPMGFANILGREVKRLASGAFTDEDILCSFHHFIEQLLIEKLKQKVSRFPRKTRNLCIAGGCALNIKWNSAVRNSGVFDEVYVPPFPNDSGSAIGMACAEMFFGGNVPLEWNVYSGPAVSASQPSDQYECKSMPIEALAKLIYRTGEPVVVLHGRAELGPRALGNRSIIAPAINGEMKDILNRIKGRELYRPVSPICMEEYAPGIFTPGTPDPFMLFDHHVNDHWENRIAAVCHLDFSARLQTVNRTQNEMLYTLLEAYHKLSGIPLLCNTSANLNGSGFFPDISSACKWHKVNYIWSSGVLYERRDKINFFTHNAFQWMHMMT
jgi:carbamoyltransferase